jgi:DNA repair ATPase RecN
MMTKWWKCDLQVATPAWKFTHPEGSNYDLKAPAGRQKFADDYVAAMKAKGIEVVALADHNSFEWIDDIKAAGARHGVVVFPGCEITTGSGADGIHLIVIGELAKNGHDFELLLAGPLGFGPGHDRFHGDKPGERQPGSSSRTVLQILEELPDEYVVIAPHVLGQNGLASEKTARGDIRWRALHHPRLNAIDPGDCSDAQGDSFNARFRRRELDHFARLPEIAFVSTSDAYSFDRVGARFCWIRMGDPSLEALRQAFLDPSARIICDWDARLRSYPEQNPNNTQHAWIQRIALRSVFANSTDSLDLQFHPGLNVLVGGRGSGKSTVVAGLRQLYAGTASLPDKIRLEAEEFADRAFGGSALESVHKMPVSQEEQTATWTRTEGQRTSRAGVAPVPTSFRVRVVNQKELFERVAGERSGSFTASRSLLSLIDDSLGLTPTELAPTGTWVQQAQRAKETWLAAVRVEAQLSTDVAQLPGLRSRIKELENQVGAFASAETKAKLARHRRRQSERDALAARADQVRNWLNNVELEVERTIDLSLDSNQVDPRFQVEMAQHLEVLTALFTSTKANLAKEIFETRQKIDVWGGKAGEGEWARDLRAAEEEFADYKNQLSERGIDVNSVAGLEKELGEKQRLQASLERREEDLKQARKKTGEEWAKLLAIYEERRVKRGELLASVQKRSGRLRFDIERFRDDEGWGRQIRNLLNIRVDGFVDDVPALAKWLWAQDEATRNARWRIWNDALISGDFQQLQPQSDLRSQWIARLATTDASIRLRLAVELPEDVVTMRFLREGGKPDNPADWQVVTEGSPGQRTAAMLGLVLHFGSEPLVLDQPEDDLDSEWITGLLVKELRASRWSRQIIVASHNANIPVNGDAEHVIALENVGGALRVRSSKEKAADGKDTAVMHVGPIENAHVRQDIQNIMEGGVVAFIQREKKYNNELRVERQKLKSA